MNQVRPHPLPVELTVALPSEDEVFVRRDAGFSRRPLNRCVVALPLLLSALMYPPMPLAGLSRKLCRRPWKPEFDSRFGHHVTELSGASVFCGEVVSLASLARLKSTHDKIPGLSRLLRSVHILKHHVYIMIP